MQRSHPNEMLTGLRYFERPIKGSNGSMTKVRYMHGNWVNEKMACFSACIFTCSDTAINVASMILKRMNWSS